MLNHSSKDLSRWCITGIPEPTQTPVFDCRVRNEGSMDLWWAESAGRWRRVQRGDGPYCRGDSEPDPGWGEPWEKESWAWSLDCSDVGGEGGRRQALGRKQRAAYCLSPLAGLCACGGEPGVRLTLRSACRTALRLRPSCKRVAGDHWGAWSHMCRGDERGRRMHWMTRSFGGESGGGGRDTPVGSWIWGWRKGRGCRSCSCFHQDGIHLGNLDSRGPCINPAWRREGRRP